MKLILGITIVLIIIPSFFCQKTNTINGEVRQEPSKSNPSRDPRFFLQPASPKKCQSRATSAFGICTKNSYCKNIGGIPSGFCIEQSKRFFNFLQIAEPLICCSIPKPTTPTPVIDPTGSPSTTSTTSTTMKPNTISTQRPISPVVGSCDSPDYANSPICTTSTTMKPTTTLLPLKPVGLTIAPLQRLILHKVN